jgi:hypothetical protein
MIESFRLFSPRIITYSDTFTFRIQKRSTHRFILDYFKTELTKLGINSSIYKTKCNNCRQGFDYILQIYGGYVFKFLHLVNDFEGREEWKQICAERIHTLAEIRKEFK